MRKLKMLVLSLCLFLFPLLQAHAVDRSSVIVSLVTAGLSIPVIIANGFMLRSAETAVFVLQEMESTSRGGAAIKDDEVDALRDILPLGAVALGFSFAEIAADVAAVWWTPAIAAGAILGFGNLVMTAIFITRSQDTCGFQICQLDAADEEILQRVLYEPFFEMANRLGGF